jgi:hypothetical protein
MFKMPPIALGDTVLWKHNRGSLEKTPAIVTRVGQEGISLLVIPPESRVGFSRDGVRHIDDPQNVKVVHSDTGVWEYTETHKLLLAVATWRRSRTPSPRSNRGRGPAVDAYSEADPVLKAVVPLDHEARARAQAQERGLSERCRRVHGLLQRPPEVGRVDGGQGGAGDDRPDAASGLQMSVNKAFEFVTICSAPPCTTQNPVRTVTPRSPLEVPMEFFPDPYLAQAIYMQQQQDLMVDSLRSTVWRSTSTGRRSRGSWPSRAGPRSRRACSRGGAASGPS